MSETVALHEARKNAQPSDMVVRCIANVKPEPINWLWKNRIARGKVSMLAGDPGLGKSQLTALIASIVTNGAHWPVDKTKSPKGSVIFLSAEDDAADTIRPRLEAVGADLDKVFVLDAVNETDQDGKPLQRCFNLKSDLERLGKLLQEIGDVALVVIDPISAYLGGTDSHKNADMRALLAPLSDLATKHRAAVLAVTHLNKGQSKQALQRVTGSGAFVAAARAAYIVIKDQNKPERRLLLPIKNNIGDDKTGFAFSIESTALLSGIDTSRLVFEEAHITDMADDILCSENDSEDKSTLDEAIEFLREVCVISRTASQVRKEADQAGFSWATIKRAQKALNIKPRKDGFNGPWVWVVPEDAQNSQDAHQNNVSTFDKFEHLGDDYGQKVNGKDISYSKN